MAGNGQAALIVGVGPGLGAALARRFAAAGYATALVARTEEKVTAIAGKIDGAVAYAADGTDEAAVTDLCARVERDQGPLGVAIYNASGRVRKGIREIGTAELEEAWRRSCLGAVLLGREAARAMVPRGSGSILFTGATAGVRGFANSAGFAAGKFGLRGIAQSIARELPPQGIHVAHFVIDGPIGESSDDAKLHPDAIADTYFHVHSQHRSAWSHEVELRPWTEKF
jgi:NAD(P)-dependent dehydrogenase (short-subunit alcohol dehydrogenase family)